MKKIKKPYGAPFIWLTSLGLSLGLMMIFGILFLITYQGVLSFWPRKVVELTVTDASQVTVRSSRVFGGEIVKKQAKSSTKRSEKHQEQEWQLFVGNKEAYGFSFIFVDALDIVSVTTPKAVMVLEREEYGRAIGYPMQLSFKDGKILAADHPEFNHTLTELLEENDRRRKEIKRIEKIKIGKINREMEAIRLKFLSLEKPGKYNDEERNRMVVFLTDQQNQLRLTYESLAGKAQHLREEKNTHQLVYQLLDGEEMHLPLGNIIGYTYPNKMNVIDQGREFVHRAWRFLVETPREANTEGGIFPAIFGTFIMTLIMSFIVTPFGIVAAIYLSEYAKQGFLVRVVRVAVNNLAGVPSIVFGVFGLGFFVYFVGGNIDKFFFAETLPTPTFGTGGILWTALTLALLTVPVVIVATEEGLSSVPRGMRESGLACGASKWQCIQRIVLPAAAPGILTGVILAMARGAGEVAPLMLVGVVKLAPTLPLNMVYPFVHLEQKFMHLGFHIYDLGFQSPDSEAAKPMVFATTLFLILLIIVLNLSAILVREILRKRYALTAV